MAPTLLHVVPRSSSSVELMAPSSVELMAPSSVELMVPTLHVVTSSSSVELMAPSSVEPSSSSVKSHDEIQKNIIKELSQDMSLNQTNRDALKWILTHYVF